DVVPLLEYVHAPHRLDQERQPAVRWRPTLEVRDPLLLGEALLLPPRPPKQQVALTAPHTPADVVGVLEVDDPRQRHGAVFRDEGINLRPHPRFHRSSVLCRQTTR